MSETMTRLCWISDLGILLYLEVIGDCVGVNVGRRNFADKNIIPTWKSRSTSMQTRARVTRDMGSDSGSGPCVRKQTLENTADCCRIEQKDFENNIDGLLQHFQPQKQSSKFLSIYRSAADQGPESSASSAVTHFKYAKIVSFLLGYLFSYSTF